MSISSDNIQVHLKQQQSFSPSGPSCTNNVAPSVEVRSVWASNLDREFRLITEAVRDKYNSVTLDTEFWLDSCKNNFVQTHPLFQSPDERYRAIKMRTDKGNIRQLGLTLASDDGSVLVWEFNFGLFHSPTEMDDDFETMHNDLINSYFFSDLLVTSGLLHNQKLTWIMFHSAYDIAYLIRLATFWSPLPNTLLEFEQLVRIYLSGNVFDVKYIIKYTDLYGGLTDVARKLNISRVVGLAHQAGSDSLLTWHAYQNLKQIYFPHDKNTRHAGVLYGIHDI
jgi:CCR4-NOT transcription complex subunit 7/8